MRTSLINQSFFTATIFLFFSSFYFRTNLGGQGLFLPFNSVVWIAVALILALAVLRMWQQQVIRLPAYFGLIIAMPLLIMLTGFIVGLEQPLSWMLRISAILLGFFLFFGLFQFNASRRDIQSALYILCGVLSLHAFVGLIQLMPGTLLSELVPNPGNQIALGFFQQPNLQASLMATAVVLSVFMLSAPDFSNRPLWVKLLPVFCMLLSAFVLLSAGSRIGILGGGVGLVLITLSRYSLLKYRKFWTVGIFGALLIGGSAGLFINEGALRAYSKMEQLAEEGQDIRKDVYLISWEVIKDKPLLGHGIGSFQRVFHNKAAEYQLEAQGFNLGVRFSHPHNEFLLWGVESGAVGLFAFLFGVVAVCRQLLSLGWQRGGAMASILLPMALHTQVEHPFYVSAYHWVIFLFLLFVVFQTRCKTYPLYLSIAAGWLVRGGAVLLLMVVLWFSSTALYYSHHIVYVLYSGHAKPEELRSISKHPFFTNVATRYLLESLSNTEKISHGTTFTLDYARWMENSLRDEPDISVFLELIRAYNYLGDSEKKKNTVDRALYLYRDNPLILAASKEILVD
ncbi:PglL family O-oligosaccharyltransferase [Neptunomonas japonica]|uniref:O-antigen polymerase n=1 Tax=Neptunomonas japonica JAMM 1380 TaxID=1441457 RepID=A0A7R6P7Y8_9GAMM|nr:Wzy polymerase domain-containing protein [Neptunomonas japonica]BBB28938.1 O-antigen polymerase [Neptunomonas japonica JAMM 1380]